MSLDIATINWHTSNGTTSGNYYIFNTSGVEGCDPGTYSAPNPDGLAEAVALDFSLVPDNYRSACMDKNGTLKNNSI
ncbi:MAG TPA: hypothetical protein PL056_11105 [bacterium]|nr:hypothetical protein [bacterium]